MIETRSETKEEGISTREQFQIPETSFSLNTRGPQQSATQYRELVHLSKAFPFLSAAVSLGCLTKRYRVNCSVRKMRKYFAFGREADTCCCSACLYS